MSLWGRADPLHFFHSVSDGGWANNRTAAPAHLQCAQTYTFSQPRPGGACASHTSDRISDTVFRTFSPTRCYCRRSINSVDTRNDEQTQDRTHRFRVDCYSLLLCYCKLRTASFTAPSIPHRLSSSLASHTHTHNSRSRCVIGAASATLILNAVISMIWRTR